jgi:putative flippase GtrA
MDMNFNHLHSRKFGYKVQLLAETLAMGAKFKEVPLKFENRTSGQSKFEPDTSIEILISCIKTRWFDDFTQKFLKFGVVGGFGFVVNVLGAKLFKSGLSNTILNISILNGVANGLAAELSISNFTWNNLWTFRKEKITKPSEIFTKFLTFNLSSVFSGILIPSTIISILTALFGDRLFLYQVIAIFGITVPLNWMIYNLVIWKKKK